MDYDLVAGTIFWFGLVLALGGAGISAVTTGRDSAFFARGFASSGFTAALAGSIIYAVSHLRWV